MPLPRLLSALATVGIFFFQAATAAEEYKIPAPELVALVDAHQTPSVYLSPGRDWMAILEIPGLPGIEELAAPELRVAGLRISSRTNGPSRASYGNALSFLRISDGKKIELTGLPAEPKISNVTWSPDGQRLAFFHTAEDRVELWWADLETGRAEATAVTKAGHRLNTSLLRSFSWNSDSNRLLVPIVPMDRGEEPAPPTTPAGPVIQENLGKASPARTYQDLLQGPYDEALFEYYATAQLVWSGLEEGVEPVGDPAIYTEAEPSPDGDYILVSWIGRPYSYSVPWGRFPLRTEVWEPSGERVVEVADLPLADQIPIAFGSVREGRRQIQWRADASATLYWARALDGGDAGAPAEARDVVEQWEAPFVDDPDALMTLTDLRFSNIHWGHDDLALLYGTWWDNRRTAAFAIAPGTPEKPPAKIIDRSWQDRYSDPGSPVLKSNEYGRLVMITDGEHTIFLAGEGASSEGDRPFLDRFNVETGETERLFHSAPPLFETVVTVLDPEEGTFLTRQEAPEVQPNYFVRSFGDDGSRQLTEFPHPTPDLRKVQKELVRYKRADGLDLTATLYLPPGYDPESDGPLPLLMWAYPREFRSADAAGQVRDSPYRFVRVAWYSPVLWVARGYAVLDDPAMPIIGEGDEEPNDTYIEQLVSSAQAAADEMVRRGITTRDRIAIGGHSYGAFMAANLLAHSDIFRVGIARSGAYNRSLTPFGFQAEERTFWEAPETYFAMSPFMHADKVNEPILLIHGEADNNSGTFPMQSERFYEALKGMGATVRFVMLPHESHGYRARESVLHMFWEIDRWLQTHMPENEKSGHLGFQSNQ